MSYKQYDVLVSHKANLEVFKCNGGWLETGKDGNYLFHNCEKDNNGYVAVGFQPYFIWLFQENPNIFSVGDELKHIAVNLLQ